MLQLHGRVERINREPRHDKNGNAFDSVTIVVQGWGSTFFVEKNRDFGDEPEPGTDVVFEVAPRPYKRSDGSVGCGWRGLRNLTAATPKGVRAAS